MDRHLTDVIVLSYPESFEELLFLNKLAHHVNAFVLFKKLWIPNRAQHLQLCNFALSQTSCNQEALICISNHLF